MWQIGIIGSATNNLESVSDNTDSHQLLAVVAAVHHQRVGQALNDGAVGLAETLGGITAGRVRDVDRRADLDVVPGKELVSWLAPSMAHGASPVRLDVVDLNRCRMLYNSSRCLASRFSLRFVQVRHRRIHCRNRSRIFVSGHRSVHRTATQQWAGERKLTSGRCRGSQHLRSSTCCCTLNDTVSQISNKTR